MRLWSQHPVWVDLAVFEDLSAGRALEKFFTDRALSARTYDDKLFRYFLFLRPPRVTYRVLVRQDHVRDADDLLAAAPPDALQQAIRCPSCGSLRVSYPQMTRKFILPTILLHLGIIFRVIDHECYCEHCHHIWNLPTEKPVPAPRPAGQFPFTVWR
jgi:hypothetical protein